MDLKDIFDKISKQMLLDLEKSRTSFDHPGMKGDAAETIFKRFLRKYLPKNLDISTGILVDTEGNSSKQLDIIISDTAKTPIFYEEDKHRVIPVECAYAVIEVKSKLDKSEFKKSFKNMESVRKLKKTAYTLPIKTIKCTNKLYGDNWEIWPVNYFIFAYDSINPETLLIHVRSYNKDLPLHSRVDSICIINEGVICNINAKNELSALPNIETNLAYVNSENTLLLFYALIMHLLNQAKLPNFNFTPYIGNIKFGPIKKLK